jgi:membrane associated rhomboid family serine protease
MILPLSHEKATVRRLPWVTLTVIAVTVLVYLWSVGGSSSTEVDRAFDEVVDYLVEHPYLEPDPEIATAEEMEDAFGRDRRAPTGTATGLEQRRLDELTASWREARESHPLRRGGLVPARFRVTSLVTHVFLHAGFLHLFFNLLFLYLTAPFVEDLWGPFAFAAFYLGSGVVAGGLYAWQYNDLEVPLIGASGAVSAVMGAFLVLRGNVKIRFLVFLGIAVATFRAPAWVMLPLWFVGELFSALRADVEGPGLGGAGVAYWAHVWGFACGLVVAKVSARWVEPPEEALIASRAAAPAADPELENIQHDIRRGFYPRAWDQLEELLHRRPHHETGLELYWQLARHLDRAEEAGVAARRLAAFALRRGGTDRAAAYLSGAAQSLREDPELEALWVRLAEARWQEGKTDESEEIVRTLVAAGAPARLPESFRVKLARLAAEVRSGPRPGRSTADS